MVAPMILLSPERGVYTRIRQEKTTSSLSDHSRTASTHPMLFRYGQLSQRSQAKSLCYVSAEQRNMTRPCDKPTKRNTSTLLSKTTIRFLTFTVLRAATKRSRRNFSIFFANDLSSRRRWSIEISRIIRRRYATRSTTRIPSRTSWFQTKPDSFNDSFVSSACRKYTAIKREHLHGMYSCFVGRVLFVHYASLSELSYSRPIDNRKRKAEH